MLMTKAIRVVAVFFVACVSTVVLAAPGPAMTGKKLIGFAPDRLDAVYLCKNIDELEKLPMDGVIISVYPDKWAGQKRNRNTLWFGGATFTKDDFRQTVAALKAARFKKLTDIFLDMQTTSNDVPFYGVVPGGRAPVPPSYRLRNVDWFDDTWEEVAQNGAVAAYIAREGGMKGIFMDAEGYAAGGGLWPWPFSYRGHLRACKQAGVTPRTPEECIAQVRKRGRQFMQAVVAEYPDITIMIIPSINSGGDGTPPFLFPAFVDGMIEASGPRATFIDGMECGYSLQRHENFVRAREHAEQENLRKSSIPELFKKKVSYGFGVWLDFECGKGRMLPGWHTDDPAEFELNYRSPARLEHSLYNAFNVSDRYVWLFTWHPQWWFLPHVRGKDNPAQLHDQCPQCPHGEIPQEYINALNNCRKPHDLHWQEDKLRTLEEKAFYSGYMKPWIERPTHDQLTSMGKNLLKNGSFEEWGVEKRVGWPRWKTFEGVGPIGWNIFGIGPSATKEKKLAREGTCSVKMTTTDDKGNVYVYLDQNMDAKPWRGKTIMFGAWAKSTRIGQPMHAQLLDVDAEGSEQDGIVECISTGKWQFIATQKQIRQDAVKIIFRLVTKYDSDCPLYFDDAIAVEKK